MRPKAVYNSKVPPNQNKRQQRVEPQSLTQLEITRLQPLTITIRASFTQKKMQKGQCYKGINSERLKRELSLGFHADKIKRIHHATVCRHTVWRMHCEILTQDFTSMLPPEAARYIRDIMGMPLSLHKQYAH